MMQIDLRSDTVTKPTPAMLEAMFSAKVGDDVYGEDESVNHLQEKIAGMFGMESALFCPSGTMTNQVAIKVLTQPQEEVICYEGAHIYKYEGGGMFFNSGVSARLLKCDRGILSPEDVISNINPEDIHLPITRLVALENTVNRGGGSAYQIRQIENIHQVCKKYKLKMHLDGARIFNALVANGEDSQAYGRYFDTISVCLSKGLGCPVGSVLLGSAESIKKAKRIRKAFGGGMRQAGFLAAAGIYALEHHIARLAEDHRRAKQLADFLKEQPFIEDILTVETNIVIFKMPSEEIVKNFIRFLAENQVKIGTMDALYPRMVTHLDFDDRMLEKVREVVSRFNQKEKALNVV